MCVEPRALFPRLSLPGAAFFVIRARRSNETEPDPCPARMGGQGGQGGQACSGLGVMCPGARLNCVSTMLGRSHAERQKET
jgi:hypothetical protein